MSYILDALQRADAERARGNVPTLNARPIASPAAAPGSATAQRVGLAIAGLVLLLAAALAWWIWGSAAPQPVAVVSAPAVTQAVAPTVPAQPAPAAAAVAVAPHAVRPPALPAAVPATLPKNPVADKTAVTQPVQAKPSTTAAATPKAQTPSPAATLAPMLSELPEATRREIPPLTINGAVYSENPAQRLLLVNGLVLNQGSQVAPDLTVVEIRSNMSEFSFRGTRFRLAH